MTVSGAPSTNAFQYTGRENDETGLYYYRARYYHPVLQRFISEGPVGFAGGDVNPYAYVGNDPISFIDPYGLFQFSAFGNTVSVGVSGTFLPVNVGYDLGGFGAENFSLNGLFPPFSVGFGIDIQINPPGECEKFVSPFVGFGRNLSIGTNVIYNPHTGSMRTRGFNLSLGFSLGIPIGVQGPSAFR